MEKINTDYKRRIWKIEAKLFNMRKPLLSPFNNNEITRVDFEEYRLNQRGYLQYKSFGSSNVNVLENRSQCLHILPFRGKIPLLVSPQLW